MTVNVWTNAARNAVAFLLCIAVMGITYLAIQNKADARFNSFFPSAFSQKLADFFSSTESNREEPVAVYNASSPDELELSLAKAANPNRTVIITTLNGAWAKENSMIDLFLESFRIGNGTQELLKNLLIVAVDKIAFNRCQAIHPHCYLMKTDGVNFSGEKVFMSKDYLEMMWRRLRFFGEILERGYSFVFSDADIMWFRDPFTRFIPKADVEIACDRFNGKPSNLHNSPNGGFMYVRSNRRTVSFFRFWYMSKKKYPGKNEQDVLNILKLTKKFARRGLQFIFLDTKYFGGYCERGQDLNLVCTMHANCCKGLKAKLSDLNNTLSDWRKYRELQRGLASTNSKHVPVHWTPPNSCWRSWGRGR